MTEQLLFRIPAIGVAGLLAAAMIILLLASHELGRRMTLRGWVSDLGSIEAMASGLLGLLLAFNFSIAQTRFDARQQLIVREANAIGTTFLRCSVLATDDRTFCHAHLKRYVDLRIRAYAAYGHASEKATVVQDLTEGEHIQNELWAHVSRVVRVSPNQGNALLMLALNDLIDIDAERRASIRVGVPQAVSLAIIFACLAWSLLLGFSSGGRRHITAGAWVVVALLVSVIFGVALDFDRPRSGIITTREAERS